MRSIQQQPAAAHAALRSQVDGLSLLCREFGFEELTERLSSFRLSSRPFPISPTTPEAPGQFTSRIIGHLPALLAEFREKSFSLLWRGSRDGFRANDFHGRCDGHPNTLTLVKDTDGNIFGGFTPIAWESYVGPTPDRMMPKADPSLRSFLFTLKNPHGLPPRKFPLDAAHKDRAIWCSSVWGPRFPFGVSISDNCALGCTNIARIADNCPYRNDTGIQGTTLLSGSPGFTVKEIEVFEVTDIPFQLLPPRGFTSLIDRKSVV
jgi:hypothetical protein